MLLAFVVGGLVVLVTTGKNPITTYRAIFDGSGLNWFFQIPWDTGSDAAFNLQQTLILTTTLILSGLAVAFAFRCGLFNIGGQGQYLAGAILAVWVGSSFEGMNPILHVVLAIVVGTLAGALCAGIAGFLKATVGAHEVISTIMLNWIVIWVGAVPVRARRAAPERHADVGPVSNDVVEGAKLHVFWGDPLLQGLHIGFFIALGALVVYWVILNRTTLGYGVKAVGFNPEAARYGGISVAAQLLPRDGDLGRVRRDRRRDRHPRLAVPALDGRHPGVGSVDRVHRASRSRCSAATPRWERFFAALLFGALLTGTSTRNLDPTIFQPELAVEPDAADPGPRRALRRRSTSSSSGSWRACAGRRRAT